jgi:methyl-accepting chemotaxis protein/ABC-type sugar transport system substrate-binding protein
MNILKRYVNSKNFIKSVAFLIIIFLFVFLTLSISAILLGFLSGTSLKIILIAALFFEVLGLIILFIVLLKYFCSIDAINRQAELISHGELNISDIEREDSFGLEILSSAFNDMKSNLRSFIALAKANIITISDAIDSVSKSIDSSYKGNEEISSSMEKVARKAQNQAEFMGDTMSKIDEVKTRIENITQSIEKVEKSVEDSVYATASGVQHLDEYYKQVGIISDNLNKTSNYIKKLNVDITQIDEIGKFITKISEQLKLLGLNASVEAAKAGESGKGFSVVAHEMNLLSAATKESIGKISGILKNIQNRSKYVSDSIDNCVESYDISKNIFDSIKQSFDTINNSANILESDIKKVHNEVYLINSSTHEINQKGLQLYEFSEDISNQTKEVSAVTQEELGELQEISTSTTSLQNMLTGIERLIKRYNTAVVPVEDDSKKQLRIAFISPLDNEYWYVVRKGYLYAKKELSQKNVIVDYYGIKEDVGARIKELVKEAIQNNVSGIIVPGFDPELAELVDAAYEKGIPVMTINTDLPVKSKRVAFFGANDDSTRAIAARLMVEAVGGKGEVAFFSSETDAFGRVTTLEELKKYKDVKVIAQAQCADSIDESYTVTKELLSKNNNIRAMFVLGIGMFGAIRAIEELGKIGQTFIISCFYGKEIAEYIQKGIVYAAISHDPFGQGHDSIIYLYNMLVTGQKPENEIMWSRAEIIDKRTTYELL